MKHFALLLSSVCLLAVPTLPARASVEVAAVDNWQCLVWLLTDPDAHAAECGGPFHLDEGTSPLVKGGTAPCEIVAAADLPVLDFLGRVQVAQSIDSCCYYVGTSSGIFDLTFGEEITVAAKDCYPD
jgi:hypothetical protein